MKKTIRDSVKSIELEKVQNNYICEWGIKHREEPQKEETNRTDLRRQRDRVLYTGGFRRLQDKTQVIAATKSGDHRTRLTHTLEVEQIAASLSDALGLNKDLVEAIALGHDIGHTPFGHAVERFLDKELRKQGGFSHAVQSVRYLRQKKIKLDNEVFEGILKHDTDVYAGAYDKNQFDCDAYNPLEPGSLEAQVVYWADKLAYLTHDLEDFYKTDIYSNAIEINQGLQEELQKILAELIPRKRQCILANIKNFQTRDLIRNLLRDLTDESLRTLHELRESGELSSEVIKEKTKERILQKKKNLGVNRAEIEKLQKRILELQENKGIDKIKKIKEEIQEIEEKIKEKKKMMKRAYQEGLVINFGAEYSKQYSALRKMLNKYYIMSPEVQRSDAKAVKVVEGLYKDFIKTPGILPLNIQKTIGEAKKNNESKERIIVDYIASMTDRYAEQVYNDLNSIGSDYKY